MHIARPINIITKLHLFCFILISLALHSCGVSDNVVSENVIVRNRTEQEILVHYNNNDSVILILGKSKRIPPGSSAEIWLAFNKGFGKISVDMGELKKTYSVSQFAGSVVVKPVSSV